MLDMKVSYRARSLTLCFSLCRNVLGHVEELVARMGPAAGKLRQSLAQLKFVKNIDLSVLFGELQEFIDRVSEGVGPMESLKNFVTGIGKCGLLLTHLLWSVVCEVIP